MLNHTFTFNGHTSDEFGIKIERFRALSRPARKYDAAAVPGRNGNLYKLQDAWDEQLVSYEIFAGKQHGATEQEPSWSTTMQSTITATRTGTSYSFSGTASQTIPFTVDTIFDITDEEFWIEFEDVSGYTTLAFRILDDSWNLVDEITVPSGQKRHVRVPADGDYNVQYFLNMTAHTYTNYPVTISVKIVNNDIDAVWTDIMEWLHSADGYAELSDTYDTTHYREAVFVDATDISNSWNEHGRAVVSFRCRPERFLTGYRNVSVDLTTKYGLVADNFQFLSVYDDAQKTTVIGTANNIPFEILDTVSEMLKIKLQDGMIGYVDNVHVYTAFGGEFNNPTNHKAKPYVKAVTASLPAGTSEADWVIIFCDDLTSPLNVYVPRNVKYKESYRATDAGYQINIDCENEDIPNENWWVTITDSDNNATMKFAYLTAGKTIIMCEHIASITMDARVWEI